MKVAVFGDSYADELTKSDVAGYKSWIEILREKYYPDLTCYGVSASSLYFSYDLFLEHHEKYDKIIFLATVAGRLTIPSYIKFKPMPTGDMHHITGIDLAEMHLKKYYLMTEQGILATKAAIEYFKYLQDHKRETRYCNLMKEDIRKVRSDVILIDTFSEMHRSKSLIDIAMYEMDPNAGRIPEMWRYKDDRRCHLSKRNNEILADKMFEWCNGTPVDINVKDFEVPSREEISRLVYKQF